MLVLALFFIILVCGVTLFISVGGKRFEEVIPLSCCSLVLVLFVCGFCGFLLGGVYIVCGLCLLSVILSVLFVAKNKAWRSFLANLFTPAFFVFALVYIALIVFNRGKLASDWDEFSHWADVVNAMLSIDDFATNPASLSMYKAYPPAMPLFQYFPQRLAMLLSSQRFCEYQLYFCYQLFMVSFFFPFLSKLSFKRPLILCTAALAVYFAPMYIYKYIFVTLLIDPFLGVVVGSGLALVFVCNKKDWLYCTNISMTMAVLVLSKDSGLLLAVALWVAFSLDWLISQRSDPLRKLELKKLLPIAIGLLSFVIPKLLWTIDVRVNKAMINQDLLRLFDISTITGLIFGRLPNTDYRYTVIRSFVVAFCTEKVSLGDTGISIPYVVLWVLLLGLYYLLYRLFAGIEPQHRKERKMLFWVCAVMEIVYISGVCISYLFAFSEFEARNLASFSRYIGVVFTAPTVMLALLSVSYMQRIKAAAQNKVAVIILCATIAMTPWNNAIRFFSRINVSDSVAMREPYTQFSTQIEETVFDNNFGKGYFICEESNGFEYWIIRFSIRPCQLQYLLPTNITADPEKADPYTGYVTPEDWQKTLMDDFDYVVIFKASDEFKKSYASLFAEPASIADQTIFCLDRETGLLELCG